MPVRIPGCIQLVHGVTDHAEGVTSGTVGPGSHRPRRSFQRSHRRGSDFDRPTRVDLRQVALKLPDQVAHRALEVSYGKVKPEVERARYSGAVVDGRRLLAIRDRERRRSPAVVVLHADELCERALPRLSPPWKITRLLVM